MAKRIESKIKRASKSKKDKKSKEKVEVKEKVEKSSEEKSKKTTKEPKEDLLKYFMEKHMKKKLPTFEVGDTVDVVLKIKDEDKTQKDQKNKKKKGKERRQIFNGIVIAIRGEGLNQTFTVRRIVQGEGVERVFPIHSPNIVTVKVKKKGKVRRAKLYYLRDRVGKATKVKEEIMAADKLKLLAKAAEEAEKEAEANVN